MLKHLWTYLQYGNRFCGIEYTTKNGNDIIIISLLKQTKRELLIDTSFKDYTLEAVAKKLPKNQHTHLVINNDKVLTKTIESDQQDTLKLIYKAFPNINLDDFYYEILSKTNIHYMTLCRKDYIEEIISEYSELKFSVINISIGNTLVDSISSFINENQVFTSNAKISIENNQVHQIEKTDTLSETYTINGLSIKSEQLLSFSGALQNVLSSSNIKTNFSDRVIQLKSDFRQTRFFNLFLKIGSLFVLSLLLLNFFFFNHYFNKVGELKQVSEINQTTKNRIIKLGESVSKKQKMVNDLLKSNGSKSSYYANEIIHSLPNSVLLKSFDYQPLLKRIKENTTIEQKVNTIEITGASSKGKVFSNWISELERKDWILQVDILDYGSTSSKVSDFKIEIGLNNE